MNLLPLINRKKRPSFISPLAGKLYKSQHNSEQKVSLTTIPQFDSNRSHQTRRPVMNQLATIPTDLNLRQSYL